MTEAEQKKLNGFLSKTLKMDDEELASLYNEAGELTSSTAKPNQASPHQSSTAKPYLALPHQTLPNQTLTQLPCLT